MKLVDSHDHDPAQEAAAWFAKSRSGQMTEADLAAMEAWLNTAPANRDAFEAVTAVWDEIEGTRRNPSVMTMRESAKRSKRQAQILSIARRAAATVVVSAAALLIARLVLGSFGVEPDTYATRPGQTSSIVLADGSKVTLDTNSTLKVWIKGSGKRRLELVNGRAFFEVAKNKSRPFVVRTQNGSVTALGTAFDVRKDAGLLKVILVEGRVRVDPIIANHRIEPVEMTAGYQYSSNQAGYGVTKAANAYETSWVKGDLVFDEEPLAVIAAEINRYSPAQIVIADPAIGQQRLSAVLKIGDTETFLSAVQLLQYATVVRTQDNRIMLLNKNRDRLSER